MIKLTPHQKTVVKIAEENENHVTKKQVMERITFYNNTDKYVGEILSRMVKMGHLIRLKPGHFKLGGGVKLIKNQTNIFQQNEKLF